MLVPILKYQKVSSKLMNTKAAGEVKLLDDFYDMLKTDPGIVSSDEVQILLQTERFMASRTSNSPTREWQSKLC
jgi:stalled ribosome rescue protein Dom34